MDALHVFAHRTTLAGALVAALGLACPLAAHAGAYATTWGQMLAHATQLQQYSQQIDMVENTLQSAEYEKQELTQLSGGTSGLISGGSMSIIDDAASLYQQLASLNQNVTDVADDLDVASQVGQDFQISPSQYYYDRGLAAQQLGGQYLTDFNVEQQRMHELPAQMTAVQNSLKANSKLTSQVGGLQALADETDGVQASMLDLSGAIDRQNSLTDKYHGMQMANQKLASAEQTYDLQAAQQVAKAAQQIQLTMPDPGDLANETFGGSTQP